MIELLCDPTNAKKYHVMLQNEIWPVIKTRENIEDFRARYIHTRWLNSFAIPRMPKSTTSCFKMKSGQSSRLERIRFWRFSCKIYTHQLIELLCDPTNAKKYHVMLQNEIWPVIKTRENIEDFRARYIHTSWLNSFAIPRMPKSTTSCFKMKSGQSSRLERILKIFVQDIYTPVDWTPLRSHECQKVPRHASKWNLASHQD